MRVLHVIPSLSSAHGGATKALELMELALRAQGISVETATTDDDGPGRRNGKPCGRPIQEGDATRWYFPRSIEFYKVSPGFARWIVREAANYDLLHIHALFSFTTPVAAWAARMARVPYVIEPLGTLNHYGVTQRRPWLKKLSIRIVEGPVLRNAAAVRFTSDQEALECAPLGIALNGVVIPLGTSSDGGVPPPDRLQRIGRPGPHTVLFLSRLDPKKNLEGLIDAFAMVHQEFPALKLVVAGKGEADYVAGLKSRVQAQGLSDRVTWTGHIEGESKARAFDQADLFALPSFSENFGIAAAEAVASGLPCLLGQGVAIAGEIARAGAGLAVAPDAASIAHGLRSIMGSSALRASMSASASRVAQERYSTDAMGASLKQLYLKILGQ